MAGAIHRAKDSQGQHLGVHVGAMDKVLQARGVKIVSETKYFNLFYAAWRRPHNKLQSPDL